MICDGKSQEEQLEEEKEKQQDEEEGELEEDEEGGRGDGDVNEVGFALRQPPRAVVTMTLVSIKCACPR